MKYSKSARTLTRRFPAGHQNGGQFAPNPPKAAPRIKQPTAPPVGQIPENDLIFESGNGPLGVGEMAGMAEGLAKWDSSNLGRSTRPRMADLDEILGTESAQHERALEGSAMQHSTRIAGQTQTPVAHGLPRQIINNGVIQQIPRNQTKRALLLRLVVEDFNQGTAYTETEVNLILKKRYTDHAALRRYLVDGQLLDRDGEGALYVRTNQAVPS